MKHEAKAELKLTCTFTGEEDVISAVKWAGPNKEDKTEVLSFMTTIF